MSKNCSANCLVLEDKVSMCWQLSHEIWVENVIEENIQLFMIFFYDLP